MSALPERDERDSEGNVLTCTGCGTTKTVAYIKATTPTAFTCCPERKMVRQRDLWKAKPGALTFVAECLAIDETLANTVIAALRAGYTLDQVQSICKLGLGLPK